MSTENIMAALRRNASWIVPVWIFLVALSLRAGFLLAIRDDPLSSYPILDAARYERWAENILSGTPFTQHAYFTEPGYAFFLAFLFHLFEDGKAAVAAVQILLGSLTPVLIFLIGKKLSSSLPVAAVAGFLAALSATPVFYDPLLLKTSLELFLLSAVTFVLVSSWEDRTPRRFFATGMLIGFTTLVKANVILTVPFLAAATLFRSARPDRRTIAAAVALVIGMLLVVSPTAIRNHRADGSYALMNTSGGPNLYIGFWEEADGSLKPPEFISVDPEEEEHAWRAAAEESLHRKLSGSDVSGYWTDRAIAEMVTHPVRTAELVATKLSLLISSRVLDDNYFPGYGVDRFPLLRFLLPTWVLIIIGTLGTALAMTDRTLRKKWLPLSVIALVYAGSLVLTHVAERYRIALFPVLLPGAGLFLATAFRRIRSGSFLPIFWIVVPFLVFSGLAWSFGREASSTTGPDMRVAIAKQAVLAGDREIARDLVGDAIRENPFHVPSLLSASRFALDEERYGEALEYARRALRADPEAGTAELRTAYEAENGTLSGDALREAVARLSSPTAGHGKTIDPEHWTGMSFFRKRDFESARPFFERAAARDPENMAALGNLATCYKNTGKPDLALPIFRKVVAKDPYNLAVRFNLAQFHEGKKDTFAAMKEYEEIQKIVPGFHLIRLNIAELAMKRGDKNRARTELSMFVDENRGDTRKTQIIREAEQMLERIGK